MNAVILLSLAFVTADRDFSERVRPLLVETCLTCHSGEAPKGKLDLTRESNALKGGSNGPAFVPGKPDDSLLVEMAESGEMPPQHPLEPEQAKVFRSWIASGGHYYGESLIASPKRAGKDWWSLQPIRQPSLPKVKNQAWVRNPIDAFVLEAIEAKGLTPSTELGKIGLIRRLSFDLTGLPPTPEEIDRYLKDNSPNAYEALVDRLLASPRYGERWGRHWLDVVRFGESHGYEMNTLRPNAWPYRDYVIRAFNNDTPLPQFALEQFAGDTLSGSDMLTQSATGFLVGGVHDMVGNATIEGQKQQRADDLDDMITAAGSAFLGLTINCARCHDHKFDPISQADYYGLQAIFAGVQHTERAIEAPRTPERLAEATRLRKEIAAIDVRIDSVSPPANPASDKAVRPGVNGKRNVERFPAITAQAVRFTILTSSTAEPCIDELEVFSADDPSQNVALASNGGKPSASSAFSGSDFHKIIHLNDGISGNSRSWISGAAGKGWARIDFTKPAKVDRIVWARDREGRYNDRLPTTYYIEVETSPDVWKVVASSSDRSAAGQAVEPAKNELKDLASRRDDLVQKLANFSPTMSIYAGTFTTPEATFRLERGDPMRPAERIVPSAPRSISPSLVLTADTPESQRRAAFARWLGDGNNPLPARVMVNRVWHYHFGRGLLPTPSDFGYQGGTPSHPALLDWLADAYRANGFHLKPIHKLIVMSNTYRQSGQAQPKASEIDRDNKLLWHRPPHRLEAEAIRDAMLASSGSLDLTSGGPGYSVWEKNTNYVVVFTPLKDLGNDTFRRMVYQFRPRSQHDTTFGAFDCPDASFVTPRRNASTTALQALNLLNSGFVLDQSERLASRVKREAGDSTDRQVERMFVLAFGRQPTPREVAAAQKIVQSDGLATLGRAIYNANEFVFVP